jgi:hypothetical protein
MDNDPGFQTVRTGADGDQGQKQLQPRHRSSGADVRDLRLAKRGARPDRPVRARPFDRIRRRHSGIIAVGLPGSIDWYDEITVEIID